MSWLLTTPDRGPAVALMQRLRIGSHVGHEEGQVPPSVRRPPVLCRQGRRRLINTGHGREGTGIEPGKAYRRVARH